MELDVYSGGDRMRPLSIIAVLRDHLGEDADELPYVQHYELERQAYRRLDSADVVGMSALLALAALFITLIPTMLLLPANSPPLLGLLPMALVTLLVGVLPWVAYHRDKRRIAEVRYQQQQLCADVEDVADYIPATIYSMTTEPTDSFGGLSISLIVHRLEKKSYQPYCVESKRFEYTDLDKARAYADRLLLRKADLEQQQPTLNVHDTIITSEQIREFVNNPPRQLTAAQQLALPV